MGGVCYTFYLDCLFDLNSRVKKLFFCVVTPADKKREGKRGRVVIFKIARLFFQHLCFVFLLNYVLLIFGLTI